ncbi:MAG TPA: [FeFe] hydrogenase H-cluster radical SAM maturase HydE [Lentisphaeria bacterium]|nr:MAG: [FeFe] hydrogenase H-cluster radical SAM maturase HydE [Lentisphaerae bacterium GWF2_50_93]HCE45848.1 [FeFe] hydrogenase H-cluster radical SAM maturase HydE [Lentisphaeria bacterium]
MNTFAEILKSIDGGGTLTSDDLKVLLSLTNKTQMQDLFEKAYEIKTDNVGKVVYFRGIIELSNICEKDCYYCGIRKSNKSQERYMMEEEEILKASEWAFQNNYGSIVLQSGEVTSRTFTSFIEKLIKKIRKLSDGKLGITLSLGEQTKDTYRRWLQAGAHRYLLRIESSNEKLYRKLHPGDHVYSVRLKCLEYLKKLGYQVGTGVMIGLPFQTIDDLVNDILFFKKIDADMIGMGPYVVHKETPLADSLPDFDSIKNYQLNLSLKMIAATRIYLKDVNIASTTALQSLNPTGREMGLLAGANIIMPNITETKYRASYQLYDNKPCLDENSSMCRSCLEKRISSIGETIGYGEWGDSRHFKKKK